MTRWVAREAARGDRSLLGFWPLASDTLDHSGRGMHGRATEPSDPNALGRAGRRGLSRLGGRNGYALLYDDFLACGTPGAFSFASSRAFSVSVWFLRTGDTPADLPLVGATESFVNFLSVGSVRGWDVCLVSEIAPSPSGREESARFRLMGDHASSIEIVVTAVVSEDRPLPGGWHHLVFTYDGSDDGLGVRCYLDGRRRAAVIESSGLGGTPSDTLNNALWVGATSEPSSITVGGDVHVGSLRVYGRQLFPNEVADLYRREAVLPTWKKTVVTFFPVTASLTLCLTGSDACSSQVTLYVSGVPDDGSLTLCLTGHDASSSQATLYVPGVGSGVEGLPLFAKSGDLSSWSGSATLLVSGSSEAGASLGGTLYVAGDPSPTYLPLFLAVSPTGDAQAGMNLWAGGENPSAAGSVDLFACNTVLGSAGTATLFLKVGGTLVGGQAASEGMPLYLRRPFEDACPLYLLAEGSPFSSQATCFALGAAPKTGSVTLAVPSAVGLMTPSADLYVNGW